MSAVDEIREAMARYRAERTVVPKGQAIFNLNRWKGEESRKLREEYDRRLAEIEEREDNPREGVSEEVLTAVALGVAQGLSRSAIRIALGKQTMQEADEVIALAQGDFHEKIESGEVAPFTLVPTGKVHGKGWPMYKVTMHDTGETYSAVYLVTTTGATEALRAHMRISPSPAGSQEILDSLFQEGVGAEMFRLGKD